MTDRIDTPAIPLNGEMRVARAHEAEVADIRALGAAKISPDIASLETFRRIHRRNRDALWGVYANDGAIVGLFAFLMLTRAGTEKLISGALDTRAPTDDALCGTGEAPHAVYAWALVAERRIGAALPLALSQFDAAVYAHTDLYARPATEGGLRLMSKLGFKSAATGGEIEQGELCVIRRSVAPTRIVYPGRTEAAHMHV